MKKKTAIRAHHAPHFYVLFAVIMIVIGAFAAVIVTKVVGQTANNAIYACSQKQTGNLRMVAAGATCRPDETSVSWNVQGPQGPAGAASSSGLPFSCSYNCDLGPFADKFAGKDFTGAQLVNCYFYNADISGVIFRSANLDACLFINSNLTGADLSSLTSIDNNPPWGPGTPVITNGLGFSGANLTNVNLSDNYLQNADFQKANLQNTNFSNTTFVRANFSGAQNMSTANVTGVKWNSVTCPDGSSSDDNGSTCVGHF